MIPQPSSFWRASLYKRVGGLNPEFQYAFDYDFFLRAGYALRNEPGSIRHVREFLSKFRVHDESKSVSQIPQFRAEMQRIKQPFKRSRYSLLRKIRSYFELARAVWRFWAERRIFVYRKEQGKA